MIISRDCCNCNKNFMADSREVNRGNGKYCSRKCSAEAIAKRRIEERGEDWQNGACAYCSTPIHITETRFRNSKSGLFFCSRSHQALGFSDPSIAVRSGPSASPVTRSTCISDGCTTRTTKSHCKSCRKQQQILDWLAGDMSASWVQTTREPKPFVKKYLKEVRGDRCEVCGFDEKSEDGRSIIQMDHVDGDYTNNALSNLKLLCPNHHAMTSTYGSRNANGGRRYRLGSTLDKLLK